MCIHTLSVVVQSSIQLQQNETGTNIYIFNRRHQSTCCLTFLSWHALSIITVFMKYHKKGKLRDPQGNFGFFNPLPLLALHCLPCLLCAVLECRWVCMHVIVSSCYVISILFERDQVLGPLFFGPLSPSQALTFNLF